MVRIITDSAADFEPHELQQMNITCIPLKIMMGDQEYEENVNLSKPQFFELLRQLDGAPKTSQASPQILMDLFHSAREAGDEAVYITLSSALSGTYQTAAMICEDVGGDNCYVVDSRNATGGQRLLVEYAVRLRDEGKSAREIIAGVEAIRDKVVLYACIDTLEYLYRGGRISQTVYKLGTMAQVKPIIRVSEEGKIEVPSKAMGMRKGVDFLAKRLEAQKPSTEHPVYVMFTPNPANAEMLLQKVRTMGYDVPDRCFISVGGAIGSHIGHNGCGIVYVAE